MSLENTYNRLFKAVEMIQRDPTGGKPKSIVNLERTQKLRREDMRGRHFNIINGQYEGDEKWLGAF